MPISIYLESKVWLILWHLVYIQFSIVSVFENFGLMYYCRLLLHMEINFNITYGNKLLMSFFKIFFMTLTYKIHVFIIVSQAVAKATRTRAILHVQRFRVRYFSVEEVCNQTRLSLFLFWFVYPLKWYFLKEKRV
jgi:hypothetical protein